MGRGRGGGGTFTKAGLGPGGSGGDHGGDFGAAPDEAFDEGLAAEHFGALAHGGDAEGFGEFAAVEVVDVEAGAVVSTLAMRALSSRSTLTWTWAAWAWSATLLRASWTMR